MYNICDLLGSTSKDTHSTHIVPHRPTYVLNTVLTAPIYLLYGLRSSRYGL
jgi:hypothetical protein